MSRKSSTGQQHHHHHQSLLLRPTAQPNGRRGSLQSAAVFLHDTAADHSGLQAAHSALALAAGGGNARFYAGGMQMCRNQAQLQNLQHHHYAQQRSNPSLPNSRKSSAMRSAAAVILHQSVQRVPSQPALHAPINATALRARGGTGPSVRRVLVAQNSLGSPKLQARLQRASVTRSGQCSPSSATGARKSSSPSPLHYANLNNGNQQPANFGANSNVQTNGAASPHSPTISRLLRRCPQSDLAARFQRHHILQLHDATTGAGCSPRGCASVSGSNESTPTRIEPIMGAATDPEPIDPVYLALKTATVKYGPAGGVRASGSRRGSHCVGMPAPPDSSTPSPRNLSQISLQDSGTYSGSEQCGSSTRLPATAGSTPHLSDTTISGGRRPKLSEKMKSLSLDCAEIPSSDQPQPNCITAEEHRTKAPPMRTIRRTFGESFDQSDLLRSASPSVARRGGMQPRRLPQPPMQSTAAPAEILHIVTHEYAGTECQLHPGDRLMVVDNGDPDWKHGFKVTDRLEQLLTFPSSCVAAYKTEEQPMRLVQTCNLVEQKLRLYRDQIVFVQPNSLRPDGHVMVRNEHDKFAHCPLQFLTLV